MTFYFSTPFSTPRAVCENYILLYSVVYAVLLSPPTVPYFKIEPRRKSGLCCF